ncbi:MULTISPECIES: GAF domain-containing protein [Bacillus]|uniref:Histidine kinase n=1 Tax=Bacillus pumilus TaxID=1408 RepID=A0A2G8IYB0_BACPU|nr:MULTISPECIES: GAF domain-containing protein [Bacillus]MCC9089749.1 GAF domain-containing protein [Bacillus pumilus]MED1750510.1 GAF domain-containing protein [Bacillus zhangzhouensis]PIK28474.1 histidine kinase [Bacillus pumilus]
MPRQQLLKQFRNFHDASTSILNMMSQFIDVNTLFIAKNDQNTNQIVKVLNHDEQLLEEGEELPYEKTFCKLAVDYQDTLVIPDISLDDRSRYLEVTKRLQAGSFIGVPIDFTDGTNYGTICGLDLRAQQFTEEHVYMFETMASLLSYVLELDRANRQIQQLSVPIVPVVDGVAVLPLLGDIEETRAQHILETILQESYRLSLSHLVIDVSGTKRLNEQSIQYLVSYAQTLRLLGISAVLTGVKQDLALSAIQSNISFKDITIRKDLPQALAHIGLTFTKNE